MRYCLVYKIEDGNNNIPPICVLVIDLIPVVRLNRGFCCFRWNVCNRTRKDFRGRLAQYWQMRPDGLNTLNLSRSCHEDFENNTYECIVR